ncbi:MAG TPA: hypothetical protein VMV46_20065 [Thermoanaerobaculia bacterium]|nr:hypothetical protein [Thermoanaerobaculia bacterium]
MSSTARPLIAALSLTLLAGCTQLSPEEQVESVRAETTVELLSFAISETPVEEPDAAAEEAAAEVAEEPAEPAEPASEPAAAVRTDVILDLLVSTNANEPLSGITVEYEHVDAAETVKDRRRLWLDTANLVRGAGAQLSLVVEDVEYQEGDGFSVSVRTPVPEAERSEYREFQGAGQR